MDVDDFWGSNYVESAERRTLIERMRNAVNDLSRSVYRSFRRGAITRPTRESALSLPTGPWLSYTQG